MSFPINVEHNKLLKKKNETEDDYKCQSKRNTDINL